METPGRNAKHRLVLELGRGGMGIVYLALSERAGGFRKLKVIKQLRRDLAGDVQFLQMFLDEARLSARLNHPNIVQTNEVGFDGRDYFIEMEYLEGQPFDAVLRRGGKSGAQGLPLPCALWVLGQALGGLHHAHEQNDLDGAPLQVVHRDVSPHNVFVTYDGAVKVLDFGIAKAADAVAETRTGVVKGKATYMAPEQAARRKVDRRADVFAVGVMLWQIASGGKRLWEGLDDVEIFLRLQSGDIPKLEAANPDAPPVLVTMSAKALAANPDERFATASEFQNAIEEYLDTTNARVGGRAVGKLVSELFAERRAAVQAEIEEQIRAMAGRTPGSVNIPALGDTSAYLATATGPTRETIARQQADTVAGGTGRTPHGDKGSGASLTATEADDAQASGEPLDRTRTAQAMISSAPPPVRTPRRTRLVRGGALLAVVALGVALGVGLMKQRSLRGAPDAGAERVAIEPAVAPCTADRDCARATAPSRCVSGACVPLAACAHNADCADPKAPSASLCRGGRCIRLDRPECHLLSDDGDVTNDRTLWLGAMFALSKENSAEVGTIYERGLAVAREDFARITEGLPAADGIGPSRPIAIVACDDTKDAHAVASYLVDSLRVPAIFGFGTSQEVLDLAPSLLLPREVVGMVVSDGSPLIAAIPQPAGRRFTWRTTVTSLQLGQAAALLVPQIVEPMLHPRGGAGVPQSEPMRLAVIRYDSLLGTSLSDLFVGALRFNGRGALENGHDFQEVVVPEKDDAARDEQTVETLRKLAPRVIVYQGGEELVRRIIGPLESTPWRDTPPYYIVCDSLGGPVLDALLAKVPSLRGRLFGMYGRLSTPNNLRFTMRYNEGVERPLSYSMTPGASYDAFYAVVYAMYVARLKGDDEPSGRSIADGILALQPPGTPVNVGTAGILEAFDVLRAKQHIDLDGASTNLEFDPKTGDVMSDVVLSCMRPIPRSTGFEPQEIPVLFTTNGRRWSGPLRCP